jgi:nucleoside-diphosphate-sugar epimerase
MYGVTKVAGELLCDYYHTRYGVDTRGLRYPGLISYVAPPGGGTTDYAVDIFYHALEHGHYTCFLSEDTQLDMMYMPDAIRAAIEVMEADPARLKHRNAFNVTAMQLTPKVLAAPSADHVPASPSTTTSIRCVSASRTRGRAGSMMRRPGGVGLVTAYGLGAMTKDMLTHLQASWALTRRTT